MSDPSRPGFIPALRFRALTPLYDRVVALATREAEFKRRLVDWLPSEAGGSLLDLGCGSGTLAIAIKRRHPQLEVCGIDADPDILDRARRKAGEAGVEIDFARALADALPWPDAGFDFAVSTLMFHHLRPETKRAALRELRRVLKPGGRLLIADFGRAPAWWRRAGFALGVRLLDGFEVTGEHAAGRFGGLLPAAGFEAVTRIDSIPVPVGQIDFFVARAPEA